MQSGEFFKRFTDHQEIGRDITDAHLSVFYDNGREVGLWREERATTIGAGSVLAPHDAEMARNWFSRPGQPEQQSRDDGASDNRSQARQWLRSVARPGGEPHR